MIPQVVFSLEAMVALFSTPLVGAVVKPIRSRMQGFIMALEIVQTFGTEIAARSQADVGRGT